VIKRIHRGAPARYANFSDCSSRRFGAFLTGRTVPVIALASVDPSGR